MPRWLKFGLLGCGGLAVLGVLLFVALLVGIGVGGNGKQGSGEPGSTSAKQTDTKKNADPGNVEVSVGEAAELRDRSLTVNEVERNYPPPNQFTRVEPGNELVRVYVTLENTSNQSINYNTLDFEAQDSSGVQKPPETITELPNRVEFGDLAPGGTMQGNVVFEAPQGDNGLRLVYTTDAFTQRTVTVPL